MLLHMLFYEGHLVMRSKRCAVQNQGITLKFFTYCQKMDTREFFIVLFFTRKVSTVIAIEGG